MAQSDREILKRISLNQAEVARLLNTSRQAINAGIQKDDEYIDSYKLMEVYDSLVRQQDRRATLVERILNERGLQVIGQTLDPLGIALNPEDAKLIADHQLLRTHLRESVSELIKGECKKFRTMFDQFIRSSA